MRHAV
jgi:hypothetical protein